MNKKETSLAIVAFLLGIIGTYVYTSYSMISQKDLMKKIIHNFNKTSLAQQQLKDSYAEDYMSFINCGVGKGECESEIFEKKLINGVQERTELYKELDKLNKETRELGSIYNNSNKLDFHLPR